MKNIYQKLSIKDGNRHTSLSRLEGEFLYQFIKQHNIKKTLEIGLAHGVSAAYILAATGAIHYAIDPFQDSEKYTNSGLENLIKLGLDKKLKFFPEFSAMVLPKLIGRNLHFDMVLMDASHKFDDIFVDFYFIENLLNLNGFILIHDVWSPQVGTLMNWIATNKRNFARIEIACDSFACVQKIKSDDRKWFEFYQFEVVKDGSVSRYL